MWIQIVIFVNKTLPGVLIELTHFQCLSFFLIEWIIKIEWYQVWTRLRQFGLLFLFLKNIFPNSWCNDLFFLFAEWHHYSLDESWDSRLSTPLVLKFSTDEEDQEFASYSNGDNEDSCLNNNGFRGKVVFWLCIDSLELI